MLLLCVPLVGFTQQTSEVLSVTGKITDAATGKSISNAEIQVQGFSNTIVKEDGTFTLKVPSLNATLVFVAQGYNSKELALCGRKSVTVALITDQAATAFQSLLLPEGEIVKSSYSNAVEQKDNIGLYSGSSLEELLQREFGSLRVNVRSGQPGSGANIYLRGYN